MFFREILKELERNDPCFTRLEVGRELCVDSYGFMAAFRKNVTLKELSLQHAFMDNCNAAQLAKVLKKNRVLIKLNLSHNDIYDHGLIDLANALKTNQALEELDLGWNRISFDGLKSLAEMLAINKTLKVLKINNQHPKLFAKTTDASELGLMIKKSSSLEHLDLGEACLYKYTIKKYIEPALKENTSLMRISLFEQPLYLDDKQTARKYIEKFSNEMAVYANYCNTYKKGFSGTVYSILITVPIVLCDMIVDYCKNNGGIIDTPLRKEVKESLKKRNQKISVPALMFFNKKDSEESVQSPSKKKLKKH